MRRCGGGNTIVTGATGFIGSNIVADLNAVGRSDIILVDDLGIESKWKNIAKRRFQDIVLPAELNALLGKLPGGDMVYHMGANSSTTSFDGDRILLSNFRASKSLWEWCSATQTPLIYASSAATYGDGALGFSDDQSLAALDALRPLNIQVLSCGFQRWPPIAGFPVRQGLHPGHAVAGRPATDQRHFQSRHRRGAILR
jgi:ADP-L-glycero-D-manno-heptose 6-epimerase